MYRRQALLQVGGFFNDVGAEFADVDLGLRLRAAGYSCVHEDRFVVAIDRTSLQKRLSFASGRAAERLFRRHAAQLHWSRVLMAHPFTWLAECICNVHRPQIVWQMTGRIAGCLQCAFQRRRASRRGPSSTTECDTHQLPIPPSEETSDAETGPALNSRAAA